MKNALHTLYTRQGSRPLTGQGQRSSPGVRQISCAILWLVLGRPLCGETGFCWGFWTPNWRPEKSFFPPLEGAKSLENQCLRIAGEKAFGVYDNNQAYRSVVSCFFSSLIAALHVWRMFVCYNACGGHPP